MLRECVGWWEGGKIQEKIVGGWVSLYVGYSVWDIHENLVCIGVLVSGGM